jgi:hypothetical protein
MSYHAVKGLGFMQYDTGRGVFRPGGRGGGIFDGNIAGFAGLGAVPAQCWEVAGFKDCHNQQFVKAQLYCNSQSAQWLKDRGYEDVDTCIKQTDSAFTQENCVSKYCSPSGGAPAPTAASSGSYPWGVYSADTLALQKQTNKALKEAGFCPTGEDGKLGKGTCGAIKKLLGQASAPPTCQSFTDPKKPPCTSGGTSFVSQASTPLTPEQQAAMARIGTGGSDWTKYLLFAGGAAVVLGLAYYLDSRRKK